MTEFLIVLCTAVSLLCIRRWLKPASAAFGDDVQRTEMVHRVYWQTPETPPE